MSNLANHFDLEVKGLMYGFQYDYMKNKYGTNSKLLFGDITSLMYEIKTGDV